MLNLQGLGKALAPVNVRIVFCVLLLIGSHGTASASVIICTGPGPCSDPTDSWPTYDDYNFRFSQSGYSSGYRVFGHFKGEDINGDGFLSRDVFGEVTEFCITHGTDEFVSIGNQFTTYYLDEFVYELGSGWLGDNAGEGISYRSAGVAINSYTSGLAVTGSVGGTFRLESANLTYVSSEPISIIRVVPEPSTGALLIVASLVAGRYRLRGKTGCDRRCKMIAKR